MKNTQQYQYIYLYDEGHITCIKDNCPKLDKKELIKQAYDAYVEDHNKETANALFQKTRKHFLSPVTLAMTSLHAGQTQKRKVLFQ